MELDPSKLARNWKLHLAKFRQSLALWLGEAGKGGGCRCSLSVGRIVSWENLWPGITEAWILDPVVLENSFNFSGPQFPHLWNQRTELDAFSSKCYGLWFHEPQGQFLSTSGIGKYGKFLNKQVEILGFQLSVNIQAYSVHFIREKKKSRWEGRAPHSVSSGAQCQPLNRVWVGRPVLSSCLWGCFLLTAAKMAPLLTSRWRVVRFGSLHLGFYLATFHKRNVVHKGTFPRI